MGKPAVFVRLSGCNLNCTWCDTSYARSGGKNMSRSKILKKINEFNCSLVVITGGEPLLQENCLELLKDLIQAKYRVVLETNGSKLIKYIPEKVKIVMDLKTPSSKETDKNNLLNLNFLKQKDEIKFVIKNKEDFFWAVDFIKNIKDIQVGEFLFSPVKEGIGFRKLLRLLKKYFQQGRIQPNIHRIYKLK
ncbi:MAG: 7-carboxy-7-deazaguanine synthase QueE [Elusimicrobiota bacterium]